MNYLGLDYGEKRIGLSFADELGIALPIDPAIAKTKKDRIGHIIKVIKERNIDEIVIGYPYNMDGSVGFKAKEVVAFIEDLEKLVSLPIHKIDERLSTFQVESDLSMLRKFRKKSTNATRKYQKSGAIDSGAAALILQDYLEELEKNESLEMYMRL